MDYKKIKIKKAESERVKKEPLPVRLRAYGWDMDHPLYESIIYTLQNNSKLIGRKDLTYHMKREIKRRKKQDTFNCCNQPYTVKEFKINKEKHITILCDNCREFIGIKKNEMF